MKKVSINKILKIIDEKGSKDISWQHVTNELSKQEEKISNKLIILQKIDALSLISAKKYKVKH